jgi:hypothetical protein
MQLQCILILSTLCLSGLPALAGLSSWILYPGYRPRRLLFLAVFLALGLHPIHGEEGDESQEEGDKADVTVDTCGKLDGRPVVIRSSTTHQMFSRGNEGFETAFSIDLFILKKNGKKFDTTYENLLSWSSSSFGNGVDAPMAPDVKAQKNSLKIWCGKEPVEFHYKKDQIRMNPESRKKIIRDLERDTSHFDAAWISEILTGANWEDRHLIQVLRLYGTRDSIRLGLVDAQIETLKALADEAADDTIARYCKRLADSLVAAKKANQPIKLQGEKKIGAILNDPIYPPLDSPSVFWKDSLLVVVQEEAAKPRMMRTFDPRTGKWGKKAPVRYPETDLSGMYEKNTGTYSIGCNYEVFCWRKRLGEFSDDPCEGLDCNPLILLRDSSGGSVESREDLVRAGGSCAAGGGRFEFTGAGTLYPLGDTKVSWEILPGPALHDSRKYGFELRRDYPVVVSPDQDWIAYALASKDGKSKELWVARLKYRPD